MPMRHTVPLKLNWEFKRLYSKGKNAASPCLAIYCRRVGGGVSRLGITVSGKLGNAVIRNRTRRRIKEAYRLSEGAFQPGYDVVVVARTRAVTAQFLTIKSELTGLFSRLGMCKKEQTL